MRQWLVILIILLGNAACKHHPGPDVICGILTRVDSTNMVLTVVPWGSRSPIPVTWRSDTQFVHKDQFVEGLLPSEGVAVTIRCRRPPNEPPTAEKVFGDMLQGRR